VLPRPLLILCGATPVAAAIADLAPRIGLQVAVHAPAAQHGLFPQGADLRDGFASVTESPAAGFVIVATQGTGDDDALKAALQSPARYVAFVGSRAKVAALKERLAEEGIAAERLADLRGPAGLSIGAVTPEEIALSVLADVVRARRANGAHGKKKMEAA